MVLRSFLIAASATCALANLAGAPAQAQSLPQTFTQIQPQSALSAGGSNLLLSQVAAPPPSFNPTALPTDVTPLIFTGERSILSRELQFNLLKHLPSRLWFSTTTEVTQRLETNPLFTKSRPQPDYVFRALPNITVGYSVANHTSVYCNYFVIKDVFARHDKLTIPTNQSLAMGIRRDIPLGQKTNLQVDFQARELWQAVRLHQFDFLPSLSITHVVSPKLILFGSTVLQMRGREYFVAPTRELDPFYTAGFVYRMGRWNFVVSSTLVTNFRDPPFHRSIPMHGNVSSISDFELNHPISQRLPGVVAFIRAEPVFNWRSAGVPGLSGFDFRLFTGIRVAVNKPAYNSAVQQLRKQLNGPDSAGATKTPEPQVSPPVNPQTVPDNTRIIPPPAHSSIPETDPVKMSPSANVPTTELRESLPSVQQILTPAVLAGAAH